MIAKGSCHGELVNFQIPESIIDHSTGDGSNSNMFCGWLYVQRATVWPQNELFAQ